MAKIIDGKTISQEIREEIAKEVKELKDSKGVTPGLAVIIVGDNPASVIYVRNKEKACEKAGIYSEKHELPEDVSEEELVALVDRLNNQDNIHGILVQLPLPEHIDAGKVLEAIVPSKDVDGFHPISVGRLMVGEDTFIPCTPNGIIELLKRTGVELKGREAVVIGRSNIVGKPVGLLLMQNHATVTTCHSRTADLSFHTKRADVLVVAIGKPELIKGDMVKEGVVVIDVGTNRVDSKLVGDVAFDEVEKKAYAITPVPGGVGPMTITMLLKNTLKSAQQSS